MAGSRGLPRVRGLSPARRRHRRRARDRRRDRPRSLCRGARERLLHKRLQFVAGLCRALRRTGWRGDRGRKKLYIARTKTDDAGGRALLAARMESLLPRVRITEVWLTSMPGTGFADRFTHLRTGDPAASRSRRCSLLVLARRHEPGSVAHGRRLARPDLPSPGQRRAVAHQRRQLRRRARRDRQRASQASAGGTLG